MRKSALSLKVSCKREPDFFSFCMSHKPRKRKGKGRLKKKSETKPKKIFSVHAYMQIEH